MRLLAFRKRLNYVLYMKGVQSPVRFPYSHSIRIMESIICPNPIQNHRIVALQTVISLSLYVNSHRFFSTNIADLLRHNIAPFRVSSGLPA